MKKDISSEKLTKTYIHFDSCPIMGCPNKKHIVMSDLIEDEELSLRLAKQRKSQGTSRRSN